MRWLSRASTPSLTWDPVLKKPRLVRSIAEGDQKEVDWLQNRGKTFLDIRGSCSRAIEWQMSKRKP